MILPLSGCALVGIGVGVGFILGVHEFNTDDNISRIAAWMTHQTLPETAPDGFTSLPPVKYSNIMDDFLL
jgi:hypothetical protein